MIKIPGEYAQVSHTLYRLGVGHEAAAAHAMAITPIEAQALILRFCGPVTVRYRGYRGRAYCATGNITLPAACGNRPDGVPYLRLGIVLHEIAHVKTNRTYPRSRYRLRPHGIEFCRMFADLLRAY